jgi:putative oxidoreductase
VKAYGLTILRLTVGALYLLHAYRLLTVVTPGGAASFVAQQFALDYPRLGGWMLIAIYGVGGLMILAGVLTRGAAAATALVTAVVLVRVHVPPPDLLQSGALIQAGTVGLFEYGVLLVVATVVLLMLGSGPAALRPSR